MENRTNNLCIVEKSFEIQNNKIIRKEIQMYIK